MIFTSYILLPVITELKLIKYQANKEPIIFNYSDNDALQKEIETLNTQITSLDNKCDELTLAKSDLTKDMSSLKMDFTDQSRQYARQIDDCVSIKHNLEQVISHLREEVIIQHTGLR